MYKAGLTKSNPRGPQTEKGGEPSAERNRPARKRGLSSLGIPRKTLSQSVSPNQSGYYFTFSPRSRPALPPPCRAV